MGTIPNQENANLDKEIIELHQARQEMGVRPCSKELRDGFISHVLITKDFLPQPILSKELIYILLRRAMVLSQNCGRLDGNVVHYRGRWVHVNIARS